MEKTLVKFTLLLSMLACIAYAQPVEQRIVLQDSLHKSKILTKPSPYYANGNKLVYTDDGLLCGKGYAAPMLTIPAEKFDWTAGAISFTLTPIDFDSFPLDKPFVMLFTQFKNHNKPDQGFKTGDTCMLLRLQKAATATSECVMLQGQNGQMSDHRTPIAIANLKESFLKKGSPTRITVIWQNGQEAALYRNGVKIGAGKPFVFPGPDKVRYVNILSGSATAGWGIMEGTAYLTDLLIVKGRTTIEEMQLLDSKPAPAAPVKEASPAKNAAPQASQLPVIPFPPLKATPKLDGDFSEYGFATTGFISASTSLLSDIPCTFYTAADNENLYCGVKCDWSKKAKYIPVSSAAGNDDTAMIEHGELIPFFSVGQV